LAKEKETDWGGLAVLVAIGVGAYLLTRPAEAKPTPTPTPTPTPAPTPTPTEPPEPVTPSAPTLGHDLGPEEGRTIVFNPWIIQADKKLEGGRWYEKVWFPQVTMRVMTPEERAQYLQRIDMMSEADRKAFYEKYGMTKELNAILTGGWTEMRTIDKRIEFMISQGLLKEKPKEYIFTDPNYKAYYDWWKNVIATQDAKTVQALQTWLLPRLQANAKTINAYYDLVKNGVWYKTAEGKWDVVTPKYLATVTLGPNGKRFVKTDKGVVLMTNSEYADYVKKKEAEAFEAKRKEEEKAAGKPPIPAPGAIQPQVIPAAKRAEVAERLAPPKSTATVTPAKPPEPVTPPAPVSKPADPMQANYDKVRDAYSGLAKSLQASQVVTETLQKINKAAPGPRRG